MASERQNMANQRNALKSTGPRSLAGKKHSSQNAIKHGLTAKNNLLPGEDPEQFYALRRAIFESVEPQGAIEEQLCERIVGLTWRMRRVDIVEVALFKWAADFQRESHDIDRTSTRAKDEAGSDYNLDDELTDQLSVGRMFAYLLDTDRIEKLSRYEASIQNQLSLSLKELRELRSSRESVSKLVDRRLKQITVEHKK